MVSESSIEEEMSDNMDFAKQAQDLMENAQKMAQPEEAQKLLKDGIEKTKEAYAKAASAIGTASKQYENVVATAQSGTQKLSEKAVANFNANSEAFFAYANALAGCGSPADAVEVQSKFVADQFERLNQQTKEYFELSSEVTTKVIEKVADAAKKASTS